MVKQSHLQLAPCLQYQDQMETELQLEYMNVVITSVVSQDGYEHDVV